MASKRKPVVRAWAAGPFVVVQVGRKAWQRADAGSLAEAVYGDGWVGTEFRSERGPTFAKRRNKWIKRTEAVEFHARDAARLNAARLRAMGRKP